MPPDSPRLAETREWFTRAARDLRAAEVLPAATPPLLGEVAFHWQQPAEKAMKGRLTCHDIPFPKSHDLARIGGLCVEHDRNLETVCRSADQLSVYAWAFRYPGDPAEPTQHEAQAAVRVAREVFEAMLSSLPPEVRP